MQTLIVNKEVPKEMKEMLLEYGYQERAFLLHSHNMTTIFLIHRDIRKNKIKKFQANVTVAIKEFEDMNFFILETDKDNGYEIPIMNQNLDKSFSIDLLDNALNMILIEANENKQKFYIRGLRALGLSSKIVGAMKRGLKKVQYTFDVYQIVNKYLAKYTSEEMFQASEIKQSFKK